jgi:hypothetical protein
VITRYRTKSLAVLVQETRYRTKMILVSQTFKKWHATLQLSGEHSDDKAQGSNKTTSTEACAQFVSQQYAGA